MIAEAFFSHCIANKSHFCLELFIALYTPKKTATYNDYASAGKMKKYTTYTEPSEYAATSYDDNSYDGNSACYEPYLVGSSKCGSYTKRSSRYE